MACVDLKTNTSSVKLPGSQKNINLIVLTAHNQVFQYQGNENLIFQYFNNFKGVLVGKSQKTVN